MFDQLVFVRSMVPGVCILQTHVFIPCSSFFFSTVRTIDVQAVEGNRISLPCPLIAPSRDKVYMVLWFRDDAGIPLYR